MHWEVYESDFGNSESTNLVILPLDIATFEQHNHLIFICVHCNIYFKFHKSRNSWPMYVISSRVDYDCKLVIWAESTNIHFSNKNTKSCCWYYL